MNDPAQLAMWSYPAVGQVAVLGGGDRVMVWHHEGDDPECFTGSLIGGSDCSCLWLIEHIERVELPTKEEKKYA